MAVHESCMAHAAETGTACCPEQTCHLFLCVQVHNKTWAWLRRERPPLPSPSPVLLDRKTLPRVRVPDLGMSTYMQRLGHPSKAFSPTRLALQGSRHLVSAKLLARRAKQPRR
eukprot:365634-Chlamydomonas_euryale.AAC.11